MLKGIDPVLTGALLKVLDEMGHGDELLISDRNYPSHSVGRPVINLGEIDTLRAGKAVLSVFPLDTFVEAPITRMAIGGEPPKTENAAITAFREMAEASQPQPLTVKPVDRHEFYELARSVFVVLQTQETAPYTNFILKKGVV